MNTWGFEPVWNSYGLVACAAIGLLALLWLCPARRRMSTGQRRALLLLRFSIILLVTLAMLRPTHVSSTTKRHSASLLVLFDASQSMQLPGAAGSKSRWEAQRDTLKSVEETLARLGEKLDLKIYAYDGQLHPVEMREGKIAFPGSPEGEQTDLGTALHQAVRQELGKRVAAVVLLGDGAQNAVDPQVDIQQAGRELARMRAPLYAVPFGPARDSVQGRDVAVENMQDHYTVFVKNELIISALLRVRGYVNQEIPVELLVTSEDGQEEVLGPKMIVAREDGEQVRVEMEYVPQEPGRYSMTLRAAEQPGELVTENNQLDAFLTVLEGGLRVLLIDGQLRWETKFLRQAINASPDMDVDLVSIDPQRRREWPVDLQDVLDSGRYDVMLLGDVDAEALGQENLERVAEAVERGKGLIMLGGFHSFGPGGYRTTPLAEVLPIIMGRFERQDFDAPIRQDLHLEGPLKMVPAEEHPILQLAPAAENAERWQQLPELQGANKFLDLKDAPGVEVLATTADGAPLLVSGEYGAGRVLALAADSTWRWALQGAEAEHRRFWRQVILWLAQREDLQHDDVWVKLPQRRYGRGAVVQFTGGAKTANDEPIPDAQLEAILVSPDGSRSPLELAAGQDQQEGRTPALTTAGRYAIEVVGRRGNRILGKTTVQFQILDRNLELSNAAADPDQLVRLAAMTRQYDGRACAPEQLPEILQQLEKRPPELELEVQSRWQLGDTPWDTWLFFLLVVGLLTTEWALRKKWGLV